MEEAIVVITTNSNKKNILRSLTDNKLLYNLKFYTFKEILKKIFFDYDNRTLEYVMKKFKVSLSVARVYLDNLYFLKDVNDDKVRFLLTLKKELEDNDLLYICKGFKDYLKAKKIVVYGFEELTLEQKNILKEIDGSVEIKTASNNDYKPLVFEAKTKKEEAQFVVKEVSKLIHNGIRLNNIKLIVNKDYNNIVKRYFKIYEIPITLDDSSSFYSTSLAKDFLNNYEDLSLEENVELLKNKYDNVNDLITIINKSVLVDDKRVRKEFIIDDLKRAKIKNDIYDEVVEVVNIEDDFKEEDYVFWLGFNINDYPKVKRDDDFLSDKVKEKLELDTSVNINKIDKKKIISIIKNIKNLIITYKLSDGKSSFYPSVLIKEIGLDVGKAVIDNSICYSKLDASLEYAKDLDELYKFNVVSDTFAMYKNNLNICYREFNNEFSGINEEKYKERLNNNLVMHYTNMEMYNECAFKYYLSKVLKIDMYEDNFKAIMGTITHHVLELGLVKDVDIKREIISFVKEKEYELNSREYFYLDKLSEELEVILTILKEQEKNSKLNKYLFENELYVYKDRENIKITFKGLIDKVMYQEVDDKEVLAVVDYKTGNTFITVDNIKYGLNMQLPIYLYLLKKSERFKEAIIAGFYIQKVIDSVPLKLDDKSILDIRKENLKLNGYTNKDSNIIELIDCNYSDSEIIKGLSYKANGEFKATAKVLSNKEMESLVDIVDEKIDECVTNILEANFKINPKVIKGKNIACTYCKFKDICFFTKKDEVVLQDNEGVVE